MTILIPALCIVGSIVFFVAYIALMNFAWQSANPDYEKYVKHQHQDNFSSTTTTEVLCNQNCIVEVIRCNTCGETFRLCTPIVDNINNNPFPL